MKRLEIDVEGRTVLITGAATGIGRATALAFAAARAAVVIGDIDPRAEATASDIVAAGGKATFQKTDVSDNIQVQALVARAVSEFGALDVAFNNAGLLPTTAPLAEQTGDDWNHIMRRCYWRLSLPQARVGADGQGRARTAGAQPPFAVGY